MPPRRPYLFLCTLAALSACGGSSSSDPGQSANLFRMKRDDLPIVVRENAELQALRETIVRSEVEGQSTIIFIIAEGALVKQGEKLVELDVSELVEKAANQGITVAKADAALKQARKEKEILEKELTTNHNTAESKLRIAEMELEKLLGRKTGAKSSEGKNGDMIKKLLSLVQTPPAAPPSGEVTDSQGAEAPQETVTTQVDPRTYAGLVDKVHELLAIDGDRDSAGAADRDMGEMANKILQQADQIRLAMADLQLKEDTLAHSRRLARNQFITRNELEKDHLAWQSQVSKVTLAWNDLDLLINYTLAKDRIQKTQDSDNAQLELERVKGSNEAKVIKADSDLDSREKEFQLAKERLENIDRQIKSAIIFAPTPGTVVYARLDRNRGSGEAVREGVQVRERQELIILPDTTKMRCVVKVQEAQIDKVSRGQPAFVSIEAFQGETFTGSVTSVAPVADSNSGWMTSDRKVYTTVVELDSDNPDGRLRSRMAANVMIMVDTIKATLPIPLQAVFRDRSVNYVWKEGADGPTAQAIRVGRQNNERVEVLGGLAEGDMLHLTAPTGKQTPKFEQPTAPAPMKGNGGGDPSSDAGGGGTGGGVVGGNGAVATLPANGDGDGDAAGPDGQRPRNRQGGGGMRVTKKFADMSPEELEQAKAGVDRMQAMIDMGRQRAGEETAKEMETALSALRKALDGNDLATAQTHQDKLRTLMRNLMGGGRSGGGSGPGSSPGSSLGSGGDGAGRAERRN